MQTTVPADLVFALSEDIRISISCEDVDGEPVDIFAPGFGQFSLVLAPRHSSAPALVLPSAIGALEPRGGMAAHVLDLTILQEHAEALMPADMRFVGELVRTIPWSPETKESWASLAVSRRSTPQTLEESGPKSLTITRAVQSTILLRQGTLGMRGPVGEKGDTGAGYGGTSESSLTIGHGPVTFAVSPGLAYRAGTRLRLVASENPGHWMEGDVTAIADDTMTLHVTQWEGEGAIHASWNLSIAGIPGAFPAGVASIVNQLDGSVTERSGFLFSVIDQTRRRALAIRRNGVVAIGKLEVDTLSSVSSDAIGMTALAGVGARPHGAWSFSLVSALRRLAFGIRRDGSVFIPRLLPQANADVVNIVAIGDSMTTGSESSSDGYPAVLAMHLGRKVTNLGMGGQTSTQIVGRAGVAFRVRMSGDQIAAGLNSVVELNGEAVSGMAVAPLASGQVLSTTVENSTRSLEGTLCGIHGVLTRTASGGPPSTIETYTFTPDFGLFTLPAHCPPGSVFLPDMNGNESRINVLWIGRNNFSAADGRTQILADIGAYTGRLTGHPRRFIVLGLTNAASEIKGTSLYATITEINAALQAAYPDNYIDVRRLLVEAFNPDEPQDVTDRDNDVPPSSLRTDATHLNNAGHALVARAVAQFILGKGW